MMRGQKNIKLQLVVYFDTNRRSLEAVDIASWRLLSLPLFVVHLKKLS